MESCLKNLVGKPVFLQLNDVVAAVLSTEEVEIETEDETFVCGKAGLWLQTVTVDGKMQQQPIPLHLLQGTIEDVSADGIMFSYVGVDSKTEVISYFPLRLIRGVSFVPVHVPVAPPEDKPRIVL